MRLNCYSDDTDSALFILFVCSYLAASSMLRAQLLAAADNSRLDEVLELIGEGANIEFTVWVRRVIIFDYCALFCSVGVNNLA
jgi:hypothetical protein